MAILKIIKAPDPILKKQCLPIDEVDDTIRRLMDDMLETMYDAPGIGLAAPQVAIHKRIIVVDGSEKNAEREPLFLANPELIQTSNELTTFNEGCLSFPDQYAEVERSKTVKVRYLDYNNEIKELDADGLLSTCIQHEIDHLNGKLFVDRISLLKRNIIIRKMKKLKKSEH
ncbi:MAG: peptide deformylase [Rhodospirillaceae bacterium]|nr:peptide deformylase [Rhodospirillaceae bacterium]